MVFSAVTADGLEPRHCRGKPCLPQILFAYVLVPGLQLCQKRRGKSVSTATVSAAQVLEQHLNWLHTDTVLWMGIFSSALLGMCVG